MTAMISVSGLTKDFVLHTQGGTLIPVFAALDLEIMAGECVCLHGPSGSGKSTLLRSLYANYKPSSGHVRVMHQGDEIDLTEAEPWQIVEVRRHSVGHVSQFLRVIPRVPALQVVAEPAKLVGVPAAEAEQRQLATTQRGSRIRFPCCCAGIPMRLSVSTFICVTIPRSPWTIGDSRISCTCTCGGVDSMYNTASAMSEGSSGLYFSKYDSYLNLPSLARSRNSVATKPGEIIPTRTRVPPGFAASSARSVSVNARTANFDA